MNFSLSKNTEDFGYNSFWSHRIKSKAKRLKKELTISHNKALNILANCWHFGNWSELIKAEKQCYHSYFPHPLDGINDHDKKQLKHEYNIPEHAFITFKFDLPKYSDLKFIYIDDYLRSCCRNAILPFVNGTEILYRKILNESYNTEDGLISGNFLYVEPYRGVLNSQDTLYFIQYLREIWREYPSLMIYFSFHGIKQNSNLIDRDWIDWAQLPVTKLKYTPEDNFMNISFEYLILKPF
ncbi:hypothetical protein [Tenacibaculum xiamenense]|uniref:hypothetical protein n=1 Tax=Tenacibaculum xiamenense TaxID=1261553 RepID=UPI00389305A9